MDMICEQRAGPVAMYADTVPAVIDRLGVVADQLCV
jgi:hypothetical protein